jgi:hypothetical protein
MDLDLALQWLQSTSVATAIRENDLLFPWIESIHVIAIVLVVGSISVVDLRLIGITSRDRPVDQLTHDLLPFTWGAFVVAAIAGALLFSSKAVAYAHNFFFQGKMVLLVLAGINMCVFHFVIGRGSERWRTAAATPVAARIAGTASLAIWITVVAFGRWIGFTMP